MDELTPEELQAILGTDYETVLADVLRRKGDAEGRSHDRGRPLGQMANGNTFLDVGGALENWNERRKGTNDARAASAELDKVLAQQTAGRKTFADALLRRPQQQAPMPGSQGAGDPMAAGPVRAPAAAPPPQAPAGPPMGGTPPTGAPPPSAAPGPSQGPPAPPPGVGMMPPRNEPLRGRPRPLGLAAAPAVPDGAALPSSPGFIQALIAKLRGQ